MEFIKKNIWIILVSALILTNVSSIAYFLINPITEEKIIYEEKTLEEAKAKTINVEIKGYVQKPGVYSLEENSTVNDLINISGGLKKNGTTKNLNLSKKLIDEALVIVSSKNSLNNKTCICEQNNLEDKTISYAEVEDKSYAEVETHETKPSDKTEPASEKVNINTASITELETVPGIGESKAKKIIEYRTKENFKTIEDIKNVSGIGDSVFEKIKDYITV